jgi:hypothetical protein
MVLRISELLNDLGLWDIQFRIHATQRMFQRNIGHHELVAILKMGMVVEQYPEDTPFASLLVSGVTESQRPLHAVIALNESEKIIFVITVYEPEPLKWAENFSRRIK